MSVPVETISPRHDLPAVCNRLLKRGIGCLPVVDDGKLVGIVSEHDVLETFVRLCRTPDLLEEFDPLVNDQMTRGLITVDSDAPAGEALEILRSNSIRHLPVLYDGWFVGIVSDRDLRLRAGAGRLEGVTVGSVMTTDLATLGLGDRLSLAARMMIELRLSAAPVTDSRRLVGIVTSADVVEWCGSLDWPETLDWLVQQRGAEGS
jgi:CBS domain-containing protein